MAEFSGGGIPPDISTCDIGANEECLASVASYSSESSSLVSDSDVKSLGFSIKGEKRPRHKERRSKGKRSKIHKLHNRVMCFQIVLVVNPLVVRIIVHQIKVHLLSIFRR
ncbi:hypothetical protein ACJJTC_017462 [Scirpophaga incertulas]